MTRHQPVSLCVMFNVVLKLQTDPQQCVSCVFHSLCTHTHTDRHTEGGIDKAAALDTLSFISPVASHLAVQADKLAT